MAGIQKPFVDSDTHELRHPTQGLKCSSAAGQMRRVAVIGAGVVGLSTALSIQRSVKNVSVTIISERFNEGTTSWGAGGFFRLNLDYYPKEDWSRVRRWATDSWKFFSRLAQSDQAHEVGMTYAAGTLLFHTPQDESYSLMAELSHDFQKLNEKQLKQLNLPGSFKYAFSLTSLLTHTPTYLRWLMKQFRDSGGKVENKKVLSISQLENSYDIVVNCCGLNAMELCQDKSMYSVMGHLVKVNAPWVKKIVWSNDCYIFPHMDYVVIGGIRQKGNYSLAADPANRQAILSKAYSFLPHLKSAPIVGEWIGLRPGRRTVRLEMEFIKGKDEVLPVVHNYGHGGHGVTLSWGTALHATQMVQELVTGLSSKL